jgi:hypothetical protein
VRFETLLADLYARFVNVPGNYLDDEIENAQQLICECLRIDQCSVWQAKQVSAVWMEEPEASFPIKQNQELLEMNWR